MHGIWNNTFTTVDIFEGLLPNFAMPSSSEFDTDKLISYLNTLDKATIGAKSLVSLEVYKERNFNAVQVETPEISVPAGEYDDTQYVTISSKTNGAKIYYTTDGTTPTLSSKVYDGINWTTVKNLTNQDGEMDEITFEKTAARYVKMQGVTRGLPYGYSLWEMEIYG